MASIDSDEWYQGRKRQFKRSTNKKKWCRGKQGIKHDYQLTKRVPTPFYPHQKEVIIYTCKGCGRKEWTGPEGLKYK